jgi:hypothetical protein
MINDNWAALIRREFDLPSHLEIQYETHYRRFLMPTIRGLEKGSKKRYAGLVGEGEGEHLVFKGLETVRTDWTPLAKAFQTRLYEMVFHDQDPSSYVRTMVDETRAGVTTICSSTASGCARNSRSIRRTCRPMCGRRARRTRRICAAACPSAISTGAPSPT